MHQLAQAKLHLLTFGAFKAINQIKEKDSFRPTARTYNQSSIALLSLSRDPSERASLGLCAGTRHPEQRPHVHRSHRASHAMACFLLDALTVGVGARGGAAVR
jgi:hypothetical protein